MFDSVTPASALALLTIATVSGGLVIAWVKWRLSGDFAGRADIAAMNERLDTMDAKLRTVPTHDDVRRLSERLSHMEANVASIGADVRGLRDGISRVERDLHLLVQHELNKSKGAVA